MHDLIHKDAVCVCGYCCPLCRYEEARFLVTTAVGKHYSLGLDLEWMAEQSALEVMQFSNDTQKVLARLLTFPLVTIAAISGKPRSQPCSQAFLSHHAYINLGNVIDSRVESNFICFLGM
jgi:hypothetical protein